MDYSYIRTALPDLNAASDEDIQQEIDSIRVGVLPRLHMCPTISEVRNAFPDYTSEKVEKLTRMMIEDYEKA